MQVQELSKLQIRALVKYVLSLALKHMQAPRWHATYAPRVISKGYEALVQSF
jgi:hypothetical protein